MAWDCERIKGDNTVTPSGLNIGPMTSETKYIMVYLTGVLIVIEKFKERGVKLVASVNTQPHTTTSKLQTNYRTTIIQNCQKSS